MWNKILLFFANQLPARIIHDDGECYLERYFLFKVFGFTFYLHRFVASDPDRGLHDHPWRLAFSIVISRWYYELTRRDGQMRKVRWFNMLTGDSFHRVILPTGVSEVWTIFFHTSEKVKAWGFWHDVNNVTLKGVPQNAVWGKHQYQKDEPDELRRWWRYAKRGKELKRDSKGVAIPNIKS